MTNRGSRALVVAAARAAVCGLVVPIVTLLVASLRATEVVTRKGDVFRVARDVQEQPDRLLFAIQDRPGAELTNVQVKRSDLKEVRRVFTLDHYEAVFGDARARTLLWNSVLHAGGGALLALLLGLPLAWLLARTDLPGRRAWAVLALAPAILPPFIAAMGASKPIGTWIGRITGLVGDRLQLVNGCVLFGLLLNPVVVLLAGRAFASVPAGPYEAALLQRGRRAAARTVVLPAVLPALAGAFVIVFVLALSDFGVPDLLSFVMPPKGAGVHVFAKEIQVQWANEGNHARATATAAPLFLVTVFLFAVALWLLRRSPAAAGPTPGRRLPPVRLGRGAKVVATTAIVLLLSLSLVLPIGGIVAWALGAGETVAGGSSGGPVSGWGGTLFDFAGMWKRTPGLGDDWWHWAKTAIAAALLATALAVPLARAAVRGGRLARAGVLFLAGLSLATPGLVIGIGTTTVVRDLGLTSAVGSSWLKVFALVARFLPYALLACWLAFRETPPGYEEAAATLGAGPGERARRVWGPLGRLGVLAGALLVLLLSLRELDAIVLIDNRGLSLRLYDKIHYSRRADEANLAILYLLHLLIPASLAVWIAGVRRRAAERSGRRFHRGSAGATP
jgi:iron(III) transport system permease protein